MKFFLRKSKRDADGVKADERLGAAIAVLYNVDFKSTDSVLLWAKDAPSLLKGFFSVVGCYTTVLGATKKQQATVSAENERNTVLRERIGAFKGGFFEYVVVVDLFDDVRTDELVLLCKHLQPFGRLVLIDTRNKLCAEELRERLDDISFDVSSDQIIKVLSGIRHTIPGR